VLTAVGIAALALVLVGGGAIAGVLLSRDSNEAGSGGTTAADTAMGGGETTGHGMSGGDTLDEIIPAPLAAGCKSVKATAMGEMEKMTCTPPSRADGLDVVLYEKPHELTSAYQAKVKASGVEPGSGRCSSTNWSSERPWEHSAHGEMAADGRVLCFFRGGNSYIVWTVGASNVLATAMTEGLNHGDLYRWWSFWHHQLV